MKWLKSWKIFEALDKPVLDIETFLSEIGISEGRRSDVINWWNSNRRHIKIHYFPFISPQPIAGVFLGEDTICINQRLNMPPHIKLFLALHESRHCDQHREGRFMTGYYDTVLRGERGNFLRAYSELERDANDFAINSMRQVGFSNEMDREEVRLRGNERAGDMVFNMMTNDIRRFNPIDFFDLLEKQIR